MMSPYNARSHLKYRVDELAALHPITIYKTKDSYKNIIRCLEKEDITVKLFFGSIFFIFPIPGMIDTIQYKNVSLRYPWYSKGDAFLYPSTQHGYEQWEKDCKNWKPRRSYAEYFYTLYDETHLLKPFENFDDTVLIEEISSMFDKYRDFESKTEKKPFKEKLKEDMCIKMDTFLRKLLSTRLLYSKRQKTTSSP